MENPFEIILKKIEEIKEDRMHVRWMKLSKWCKETGVSPSYAKKVYGFAIRRPDKGLYMIDVERVDKYIDLSQKQIN